MKAVNILIGLVLFSIGLSLMFSLAGDIFKQGKVDDETIDVFTSLAIDYEGVSKSQTDDASNIRSIEDAAESGPASSEDSSVFLLTGAIQGGRLIIDSVGNFNNIANNVSNTIDKDNPSQNWIDPRIINTIMAIFAIFIIIISIQFLRGFKFET